MYLDRALTNYSDMLISKISDESKIGTSNDHCNLWAVVCLMIASKFDEFDHHIPFYKDFIKASTRAAVYNVQQFHVVEEFFIK